MQSKKQQRIDRDKAILADHVGGMNFEDICRKHKCGNGKIYGLIEKAGLSRERYEVKDQIKAELKAKKKEEAVAAKALLIKEEPEEVIDDSLEKRTCTKCGLAKNLHHFSKMKSNVDGLNYQCKKCVSVYAKNYSASYYKDQNNLEKRRENDRNIRRDRVNYVREKKKAPCKDCNNSYEPHLMDFDHLDDKHANVSRLALDRAPIAVIDAEIAKCELVCVWCHYTRTHNRSKEKHGNDGFPVGTNRREKAIYSWNARDVPCGICNQKYEPYQMQFDHLPGHTKVESVSKLVNNNRPFQMIKDEIAKCQIICCGCHRTKSLRLDEESSSEDVEIEECSL